ncbi:MAG: iron-containing alcohol dehydrogenase [Proteobacteria bacterium]|nr:iron-containing alcohol dehydrogenase [Pseudomonadota bacterium]
MVFGAGSLDRVGELAAGLGGHRVLLVTDAGIVRAGHAARAVSRLQAAGLAVTVFDAVRENPTTLDVARGLEAARGASVDLFVGLGGGSSIDTAKGVNFLLTQGGEMRDYQGVGKATRPMLPLIAIPTTAGTGSECQSAALIADEVTHHKMACLDPKAAARIALLDPELTVSQPRRVTALTGLDALVHAVESAVTTRRTVWSSMFSREAFRLCSGALETVLQSPQDLEARGRMLLGAAMAGTAIENSMLGAAHSAANPLTAHFGIVHGAAVGLMIPQVIRFNAADPEVRGLYADLATTAGWTGPDVSPEAAASVLADRFQAWLRLAEIPETLTAAGVDPARIPLLAEEASRQWTATFNPRPITAPDFERLYRQAL